MSFISLFLNQQLWLEEALYGKLETLDSSLLFLIIDEMLYNERNASKACVTE
jgi:hypothetical protein